MISHEFKCIFIHIPKCAGTSIETALGMPNRDDISYLVHHTLREAEPMSLLRLCRVAFSPFPHSGRLQHTKRFLRRRWQQTEHVTPQQYSNYFKFAFVRNPWARAFSYYKFIQRENLRPTKRLDEKKSLAGFLEKQIGLGALKSQMFWLQDGNGQVPLDFIGRFERLSEDFSKVVDRLGLEGVELPNKLVSGNPSYVDAYDDRSRQLISDAFQEEIEYFDYAFGQ